MITYGNKAVQTDLEKIVSEKINWEKLRNKTILITGANGMLATYLVYVLHFLNENKNYKTNIISLVRNEEKAKRKFSECLKSDYFRLLVQDVNHTIELNEDLDYIIHAAGNASPKFILNDPVGIIKANTIGTINILELAKKKNISNLLFTSTREVYGKMPSNTSEIHEFDYGLLDSLDNRSCYPESKRMSETLLKSYHTQFNIPFTIARIAHSYGPGIEINQDGRVMSDLISDIVNHKNILLKSDGMAERAFCYINDTVTAMFTILLHGEIGEAYNIANETEPILIRNLAEKLVEIFPERGLKVVYDIPDTQSEGYSKMGRVKLNTTKLENLGWKCKISLEEGLFRTVSSFE